MDDALVASLTQEECDWISGSRHPLAGRIRLHAMVVAHWPYGCGGPFQMISPLFGAMRYGLAGVSEIRPDELRGPRLETVARRLRVSRLLVEHARLWHGIKPAPGLRTARQHLERTDG